MHWESRYSTDHDIYRSAPVDIKVDGGVGWWRQSASYAIHRCWRWPHALIALIGVNIDVPIMVLCAIAR